MLDCGLGCRQLYTVFRSPDTGRNGVGMARTKGQLPLPTVRRSSVELEVYRVLRQALLSGRLGEERLVQEELAASLGVSRISVRTALQRLETEGLVTIDERGSYYAKRIDLPDLEEVYSLRAFSNHMPHASRFPDCSPTTSLSCESSSSGWLTASQTLIHTSSSTSSFIAGSTPRLPSPGWCA